MHKLIAISVLALIGYAAVTQEPAKPAKRDCTDADAFYASHRFVRTALKAPATAAFPWRADSEVRVARRAGCDFTVSAYVDAENSFGALIRNRYSVDLRYDADANRWTATSLSLD